MRAAPGTDRGCVDPRVGALESESRGRKATENRFFFRPRTVVYNAETFPNPAGRRAMADSSNQLQPLLARLHAGDATARDDLFRHAAGRLERLTRKMLHGFPTVHRWAGTDDVLQGALVRLLRSLEAVRPTTPRDFLGLAAEQIRRELLDLARHFYGPLGVGANHASRGGADGSRDPLQALPDAADGPDLGAWCEFHEQVRQLPPDEREVVDLLFYQELTQAEAAGLLDVTVRTVQRRWQSALLKLHGALKPHGPGA